MAKLTKAQIPNLLCALRIALIIPLYLVWSYASGHTGFMWLAVIFIAASVTDWLDGFLARKWQVQNPLGAMLDQIADKLIVATTLIILANIGLIYTLLCVLIILREIWVSGVREYAGSQGKELPVSRLGKLKTATQMIGIIGLLLAPGLHALYPESALLIKLLAFGHGFAVTALWISAIFGWISAYQYSRALWR